MTEKLQAKTKSLDYKTLHKSLKAIFEQHQNPVKKDWMEAYMRFQFKYYGIQNPIRVAITRELVAHLGKNYTLAELQDILYKFWCLPQREYTYFALDVMSNIKAKFELSDIEFLEKLILTNSWWDTIDNIAPNIVSEYFKQFPKQIKPVVKKWAESGNIWLIRSTILFQMKYKKDTDEKLLYSQILKNKSTKEFFIQKAMGWALRQYTRTNVGSVKKFVEKNKAGLPVLTVKEALKRL